MTQVDQIVRVIENRTASHFETQPTGELESSDIFRGYVIIIDLSMCGHVMDNNYIVRSFNISLRLSMRPS